MTLKFYVSCGYRPAVESIEIARRAEACGFGGVAIADHVFYSVQPSTPYPYTETGETRFELDAPFPDVWVMVGALGAATSTIHILVSVLVLPLRHPILVARAAGTAAVVTNGRLELGVGVGHLRDEFEALGVDFRTRGRRTDDAIAALRSLMRAGPVSYHGEFVDVGPVYIHPAPERPVPLFVGGESMPALRRAARLGDGFVSVRHTMDEFDSLMTELTRLRTELAPDLAPLRFHGDCTDATTVDDFRRLADAGAEAVKVRPYDLPSDAGLDARIEWLERFADSVVSRM